MRPKRRVTPVGTELPAKTSGKTALSETGISKSDVIDAQTDAIDPPVDPTGIDLRRLAENRERGRLTIPSPKTEHLPGRSYRVIPLFSSVRPFLEATWDEAPVGAEYVIPEEYRRRAQGPAGWANANLLTTFGKIIRRADLEPWPRLCSCLF